MKRFFTLAAIFALVFAACEQPTNNGKQGKKLPSLTISNESSFVLTDVKFSGISFSAKGSTGLPISNSATKQLTANDLNKTGYITFVRKDIGIALRTTEPITITDENDPFTFTNNTPVEEQANTSNKNTLSQISFLSKVAVERDGRAVAKGDTIPLGEVTVNTTTTTAFTLKNAGVGKLLLTGNEPVKITGDGADDFSAVQPSSSEIAPDGSLTFSINCSPKTERSYNVTVTINSNDQSGDFTFAITATGVPPKPIARVFYEDTEIIQEGTINAGEVIITQSKNITVVIKNTGAISLTLETADIAITGADADAFVKTTSPGNSISADGQTSFIIECKPTKQGENNAVLTIPTNVNSRNPIVIILRMTAVKGSAVLELSQGSIIIAKNSITPFDFGQVELGTNKPLVFTIKNTGNIALELTGTPAVTSSNAAFVIQTQPANKTIIPGGEVSFLLQYNPVAEAEENASITIYNNSDGMVSTLTVKGTGYVKRPQITVQQGVASIEPHGEYDFGTVAAGKSSEITFTIKNSGEANLTFNTVDNNRINLADDASGFFSVTHQPSANAVVTPTATTTFVIRFNPATVSSNFTATVKIATNSRNNDEFAFTVKGAARAANSEARLSGMQFSAGTLVPQFNASIYEYDLKIQSGPTLVNVQPTSMDSNITTIRVNGISQASGVLSQDIILASNNTVTIEVYAEDATSTATYTVNLKIVKTWERLHGVAGRRYGIFRAISNGQGGIYAGGYTSNSTAAWFNIDGNGDLINTFTFSSYDGTLGPDVGMVYNDFFSVYSDSSIRDYYITKTTNPAVSPSRVLTSLTYNGFILYLYPTGIVKNASGWYYVAGNAHYAATTTAIKNTYGVFVNRHYNNGNFEKGKPFSISLAGIKADTFEVSGMTLLTNGDVLLYGQVETTAGITVAFASAVNISAENAASWTVRWTNTYEIANKTSSFLNLFWDNASNVILAGETDDGGFVVKFPGSATTAADAKPSGWPKIITGTNAGLFGGLAVNDGTGYLFVGEATGSHGEQDIWVVKTDANMGKIWEKYFGGSGNDYAETVIEVSDGFIIAGATNSPVIAGQSRIGTEDIYILKINKDGTMD